MRIRESSRAILVNELEQILLEKFEFKNVKGNKVLWVTPGGGIHTNETPLQALIRELYEELGLNIIVESDPILKKDVIIEGKEGDFISREFYYKIVIDSNIVITSQNMTLNEKDTLKGLKWWNKKDLIKIDNYAPEDLINYI